MLLYYPKSHHLLYSASSGRSAPLAVGKNVISGKPPSHHSACSRWAAPTGLGSSNASINCAWICATAIFRCTGIWRVRWRRRRYWEGERQEENMSSSCLSSSLRLPPRHRQVGFLRGGRPQRKAGTGVRRWTWVQRHQQTHPHLVQDSGLTSVISQNEMNQYCVHPR